MPVLTRNEGQSIVIQTNDGDIEVCIFGVNERGQVKVGVQAPDSVDIWRSELLESTVM